MNLHRWIVGIASRLVPRSLRDEWTREWSAELDARESRLDAWQSPTRRDRLRLIRESSGAIWDALWLRSTRWPALRFLTRHWRLTLPAGMSLALALAAAITAAGVYEALLLRPPGVDAPDRLLTLYVSSPTDEFGAVSIPEYDYYRQNSRAFISWAAFGEGVSVFTVPDVQERVVGMSVSENYFSVLGTEPRLGSLVFPTGPGADHGQVIVSEALWRRLGADPGILGRALRLNRTTLRVSGVAPATFTGMSLVWRTDIWFPIAAAGQVGGVPTTPPDRTDRGLMLVGRMTPAATRDSAGAEVEGLSRQLAAAYPQTDAGRRAFVTETTIVPADWRTWVRPMLGAVVGLAVLTLLVASANTINLLLGLAMARRHELLVRRALGASRLQLALPLVRESLALGVVAGAAGLGAAYSGLLALSRHGLSLGPDIPPPTFDLRPDATVLLVAAAAIVLTGLATGLVPAWRAASDGLAGSLTRESPYTGSHGSRIRGALILVQVGVATVVLAGVGVAWKSVANLRHADLGFTARHVMAAAVPLDMGGYDATTGRRFYDRLRDAVAGVPGITGMSLASAMPIDSCCEQTVVRAVGGPDRDKGTRVMFAVVDDRYFSLLGMPVREGRTFDARDVAGGLPVIVVNQQLARSRWPGSDPIGQELSISSGGQSMAARVIGLVADGKYGNLDESPQAFFYYSLRQRYVSDIMVVALTASDSPALKRAIHDAIIGLDPRLDIWAVRTLTDALALEMTFPNLMLDGIGGLALLAILLTAVGLYGTVLHTVRQRRTEIGIRMALGARPRDLLALVLRRVVVLGLSGAILGAGLTLALLPVVTAAFYGVRPVESVMLLAVIGLCVSICLGVAYLAARPWTRASAMDVLRSS